MHQVGHVLPKPLGQRAGIAKNQLRNLPFFQLTEIPQQQSRFQRREQRPPGRYYGGGSRAHRLPVTPAGAGLLVAQVPQPLAQILNVDNRLPERLPRR